jgi:hypothetical protein
VIHRREMPEAFGQAFTFDHGLGGHGQNEIGFPTRKATSTSSSI